MSFLEKIAEEKRRWVAEKKRIVSVDLLKELPNYKRDLQPFQPLKGKPFIIAEFKRRSPSRPDIALNAKISEQIAHYDALGVSAISVLTDEAYFGGSLKDLSDARQHTKLPLLRKDFVVDAYQIHEAKAFGANMVLLIAAMLEKNELLDLYALAQSLNLEVLLEIHEESELEKLPESAKWVGVNSRNLKSLATGKEVFREIFPQLPVDAIKVAESSIQHYSEVEELMELGYQAFLIGEALMTKKFKMPVAMS
ncbi:MAG: indole-3-glycerol phosphate synthase TrpC [Luteibaculum sp.]